MDSLVDLVSIDHTGDIPFRTYFDISPDCMLYMRVEGDGRFVYDAANQRALNSVGLTLDQLIGRTPEDLLGPNNSGLMTEALRIVLNTGKAHRCEPTWEYPTGPVTYDAVYIPEKNMMGEVVGILGIARNITKQRELEANLHQARKMEAMGQLASGVAHDFNNVLATVQACLQLLQKNFKSKGAEQLIEEGLRTVARGGGLTSRMLDFARIHPLALKPVDLNALLVGMSDLLSRTLGSGIIVEKDLADHVWQILADRNELEVAFLNIALNARDAMPNGGTLTIQSRKETISENIGLNLEKGDYVAIRFTDTGEGMPAEILTHALDPFFTTKPPGKGTGLGLSMINSMVQKIGGAIVIDSKPGIGSTISLFFPRTEFTSESEATGKSERQH